MFLESNGNIVFENEVKNAKLRFLSSNPCITGKLIDYFYSKTFCRIVLDLVPTLASYLLWFVL